MEVKKHFSMVRPTEHRHRLLREVMETPSSEIVKSCLNTVLGNWL